MSLAQIMNDSDIASGIVVCKTGFTRDTLTYAEHLGMKQVELREAAVNEADFDKIVELGIIDINVNAFVSREVVTSIDFGGKTIFVG